MRLLVTEFITGGGLADHPLPESLKQEGLMMLNALLSDCISIDELSIVTTLDERVSSNLEHVDVVTIKHKGEYINKLEELAKTCDCAWVIAPETEGVLETLVTTLKQYTQVINCDAKSIHICSDKLACNDFLSINDVDVIPILSEKELRNYSDKVIIKKRFGVGCEGLCLYDNAQNALNDIDDFTQWIVQPYVNGESRSLSMICVEGKACVLSCNQQILTEVGSLQLKQCNVNATPVSKEYVEIASRISKALPGLCGYVGVDFIETDTACYIVDINPRLTSSYVGLNKALNDNPANLCLNAVNKKILPSELKYSQFNVEVSFV